ncbi:MAG: hypothetical protein HQK51_07275 [Oligoflexia bacterium]|nr:hypothetical protein [Oligoflexia bacterium]
MTILRLFLFFSLLFFIFNHEIISKSFASDTSVSSGTKVDKGEMLAPWVNVEITDLGVLRMNKGKGIKTEQRKELLNRIRKHCFSNRPQAVFYPGSGGDIDNVLIATGAKELFLADVSSGITQEILKEKLLNLFSVIDSPTRQRIPYVRIEENITESSTKVPSYKFVVKKLDDELETLLTVNFVKNSHDEAIDEHKSNDQKFDVIFDKESWLDKAAPGIEGKLLAQLNTNGFWITNHLPSTVKSPVLREIYNAIGLTEITGNLDREDELPLSTLPYGYSQVRIFKKERKCQLSRDAYTEIMKFVQKINPLVNLLEHDFNRTEYEQEKKKLEKFGNDEKIKEKFKEKFKEKYMGAVVFDVEGTMEGTLEREFNILINAIGNSEKEGEMKRLLRSTKDKIKQLVKSRNEDDYYSLFY